MCYRLQLPLKPAWAVTIHKSQGMSLDAAAVQVRQSFSTNTIPATLFTTPYPAVYHPTHRYLSTPDDGLLRRGHGLRRHLPREIARRPSLPKAVPRQPQLRRMRKVTAAPSLRPQPYSRRYSPVIITPHRLRAYYEPEACHPRCRCHLTEADVRTNRTVMRFYELAAELTRGVAELAAALEPSEPRLAAELRGRGPRGVAELASQAAPTRAAPTRAAH